MWTGIGYSAAILIYATWWFSPQYYRPQSDGSISKYEGKAPERGYCGELASAADSWFVYVVEAISMKAQITGLRVVVPSWAGGQSWNSANTHLFMQSCQGKTLVLLLPFFLVTTNDWRSKEASICSNITLVVFCHSCVLVWFWPR